MAERRYPADREAGRAARLLGARRGQAEPAGIDAPIAGAQHHHGLRVAEEHERLDDLAHLAAQGGGGLSGGSGRVAQHPNIDVKAAGHEARLQSRRRRVHGWDLTRAQLPFRTGSCAAASGILVRRDCPAEAVPMNRPAEGTPSEGGDSAGAFGSSDPFSLGVEEELFLVDPVTGRQANTSAAVLERLGDVPGTVERELHACQIELVTEIHASAAEAVAGLGAMRRAVLGTGAGLLGSGTHPAAAEGDAEITDKERYERIRYLLGDAVATPVGGLHIHIGMPDAETAIRAFNGLRRHLPLLQALAANSPFRHGRDTGLASAREVTLRGWPRSGVPRAMANYSDFCDMTAVLTRAADVPDYTWFWWKLRPHPRLGTVEIRALDVQASLADTATLVALVHCLARHEAENGPGREPPAEVLEEGMFRAARFGVHAHLPDADGRLQPVSDLLEAALDRIGGLAGELRCRRELSRVPEIIRVGGGAGRQHDSYGIAGLDAVIRDLTELTRSFAEVTSGRRRATVSDG